MPKIDRQPWAEHTGAPVGHCLENRSDVDAVILVVGTRAAKGVVHYPDHDMTLHHEGQTRYMTDADGTVIRPKL